MNAARATLALIAKNSLKQAWWHLILPGMCWVGALFVLAWTVNKYGG